MPPKLIQAVGLDLDGTLLNHHFEISHAVQKAFERAIQQGLKLVVITGRDKTSALPFLSRLNADQTFICSGGAQIYIDGKLSVQRRFTLEQTQKIFDLVSRCQAGMYIDHPEQTWRYGSRYYTELFGHVSDSIETNTLEIFLSNLPIKISVIQEPNVLDEIRAHLLDKFPNLTVSSPFQKVIDINPENSNKGHALYELAAQLGIDIRNIAVIGDSENDLSMFAITEHSYAMGNAPEKIRASATYVGPSNADDGVVWVLNKIEEINLAQLL